MKAWIRVALKVTVVAVNKLLDEIGGNK